MLDRSVNELSSVVHNPCRTKSPKDTFNFCSLAVKTSSQKSGGPRGQPRSEKPWLMLLNALKKSHNSD